MITNWNEQQGAVPTILVPPPTGAWFILFCSGKRFDLTEQERNLCQHKQNRVGLYTEKRAPPDVSKLEAGPQ